MTGIVVFFYSTVSVFKLCLWTHDDDLMMTLQSLVVVLKKRFAFLLSPLSPAGEVSTVLRKRMARQIHCF
jgi:hypothetical protein